MQNNEIQFTLLIVFLSLVVSYSIYLVFDFSFMWAFKKKVNVSKKQINILIFQKAEVLYSLYENLKEVINEDSKIKVFFDEQEFITYKEIDPEKFQMIYIKFDELYKEYVQIMMHNKIDDPKKIKQKFNLIEDINKRYFSSSQLYNSNVVGFNYWRNLFLTKWFKKMCGIKEIELIS